MNAIYQLKPENFGINAAADKPVSLLNSWRFKQAEEPIEEKQSADLPESWLPADDVARLDQSKYDLTDAMHIRDAMLNHTIAGYLSDRDRDEVKRVSAVVDFVCQNVALWKDSDIEIPLNPFLALQFGRGSADDRAFVIAEILRQLRIDSIIVRSNKDVKESSDNWLFGALVGKQTYLYDLKLGMPVPGDPNLKSSVATLAGLTAHLEWLEQLSTTDPYRITQADLTDPAIYVISTSNYWSHRMRKLEQSLPTTEICVLFDPPHGTDGHPGFLKRIAEAGNWPVDHLRLWGYPRRQMAALKAPSKDMIEELQRMTMTFSVPIPVKWGEDGKPSVGAPERKMQRYRMDQILGKFNEATKRYLSIRHLEVEPNPPEIERLNRLAAEDAFYWTCLCKYEAKEFEAAVDQINAYIKKYDRNGKWYYPARSLLARSYAELKQFPQAISTLQRTSADDPYRLPNAIYVKRWSEAR